MKTLELEQIGVREMDAVEIKEVEGGHLALAILGGLWVSYQLGVAVGKEIYHLTN